MQQLVDEKYGVASGGLAVHGILRRNHVYEFFQASGFLDMLPDVPADALKCDHAIERVGRLAGRYQHRLAGDYSLDEGLGLLHRCYRWLIFDWAILHK